MLPRRGDMLHDSHAEVLARRAARVWLLKRLLCEFGADDGDAALDGIARIFERDPLTPSRWQLESGTSLHLYCSTLPCTCAVGSQMPSQSSRILAHLTIPGGDASSSVLLQQRGGCALEDDEKQQGTLRGRASLGNTHLHLRTKPGRPQSMASISMSCTDKLAMWSVVGMQGSLLSQWMDPIFFRTLVVGTESLADGGQTVMCAAVHRCQAVLHAKVMHAVPEASALQVLPTRRPFVHSREQVVQRLLAASPDATVTGKSDELDYVPAPGCECTCFSVQIDQALSQPAPPECEQLWCGSAVTGLRTLLREDVKARHYRETGMPFFPHPRDQG